MRRECNIPRNIYLAGVLSLSIHVEDRGVGFVSGVRGLEL